MKRIHFTILFLFFSVIEVQVQAQENEAVVIEVRKNISLSKNDKVYKNFFINGGENLGLKKGHTVEVLRRVPFHDPLKNISVGDIRVKVGELEIIHSEKNLSVAKLISQESSENRPVLDYEAVMVGDRLDLGTIRAPKKMETPDVNAAVVVPVMNEIPGEKVALLNRSDKAKRLMKEGEQHLETLADLKMNTGNKKPKGERNLASIPKKKIAPKKKK
jgi:hypothetical protein